MPAIVPEKLGTLFPTLFITIACGAISGFHSLVGSGTSSKQLDKESDAKPIAYGGMLIECALALVSLCAVAFLWADGAPAGTPTQVFATGLSKMIALIPGLAGLETTLFALLILTVSVFCLTSLDTATRLARYMFQEFWLKPGETYKDVTGFKAIVAHPIVATAITVVLGVALGMNGYATIWPLFGAANQLLAALALLAVCCWLGNIGKNNKMFYLPMAFMLVVTLTSLFQTIKAKITVLSAGYDFAAAIQLVFGALLFVLAIVLAVEGCIAIFGKKKAAK
jgi:carbon starvation protein